MSFDVSREGMAKLVKGRSVAIVGNAPTAAAFDHAERIDGCEVVIRFNRFVLADFPNVGSKTTVIALPLGWTPAVPQPETIARVAPKLVLAVCPRIDASVTRNTDRFEGTPIEYFPIPYFGFLTKELGCRPTTGFAVLCALLEQWEPASIYVTGLSFQRLSRDHYFAAQTFNYSTHDPLKELHLFARKYRPALVETDPHIRSRLFSGQRSNEYEQHIARGGGNYSSPHRWVYDQIAPHVGGKRTLEVGAGIGYGINVLRRAGADVTAIEPDPKCCQLLRERFPDLEVSQTSLEGFSTPIKFACASVVEVAEHLPPIAVHPFLMKLRSLADKLFLSSPDRRVHSHGVRTPLEWSLALQAAGWTVEHTASNAWARLYVAH